MAASASNQSPGLEAAVRGALQADRIPGVEIGVAVRGKLVLDAGYGLASVDAQIPVTPATHFEIGSITKQFIAASILQLKEHGKLKLSDRLGRYVPEYPQGKNVTIEQLLWQVSGIPDYINGVPGIRKIVMTKRGGLHQGLLDIKGMPLYFKPGTKWRYSNTNYLLLGAVVARVSHQSWKEYLREHIFAPAGMTQTGFISDESHLLPMAVGYATDSRGRLRQAPHTMPGWGGPDGAIVSTAADLARWDDAFFSGRVVNMADVRLATAAHHLPSGASTNYGFGWMLDDLDGQKRIWHGGTTLGFDAQNAYFPALHEAVIVLTNSYTGGLIAPRVFEALHPALAAAARKPAKGEDPKITALATVWIHRFQTGTVDKSQLTAEAAAHVTPRMLSFIKSVIGPLGDPTLVYLGKTAKAGSTTYDYRVDFKEASFLMHFIVEAGGKVDPQLSPQ